MCRTAVYGVGLIVLTPPFVILTPPFVILTPPFVILTPPLRHPDESQDPGLPGTTLLALGPDFRQDDEGG